MFQEASSNSAKIIFLVDIQSFYASIEKISNPFLQNYPIVVAGDPERRSGIILAACPLAKKWGIQTAEAVWEAEQKCPQLVIVRPHMQKYIDVSLHITSILQEFSDLIEPYSIDEQFIDMSPSLHLFGSAEEAARLLQEKIKKETGVNARIGIGGNKILAKMACDNFAKKNKQGIFYLKESMLKEKLWALSIGKLFGVGSRMKQHLERIGIRTIGQLALYPLSKLQKKWGINGQVLWMNANGLDHSPITVQTHQQQKAIGHHMTLPRDYENLEDIKVILLELSEEVGRRARLKHYLGHTISIGIRGVDFQSSTGFHRQIKLMYPTNFGTDIFKACFRLFQQHWDGQPIRSVGISLSGLQSTHYHQLSFFEFSEEKEKLYSAIDQIKNKYGSTAIIQAVSLTAAGQAIDRSRKIGGHYK